MKRVYCQRALCGNPELPSEQWVSMSRYSFCGLAPENDGNAEGGLLEEANIRKLNGWLKTISFAQAEIDNVSAQRPTLAHANSAILFQTCLDDLQPCLYSQLDFDLTPTTCGLVVVLAVKRPHETVHGVAPGRVQALTEGSPQPVWARIVAP